MTTTFGIGHVLASGFRIWLKNFIPFTLITALIYSPMLIWGISIVQGELDGEQIVLFEQLTFWMVVLVNIVVSAALSYGVVMELQGRRASLGACIATGLARFFPVLGTSLLTIACIVGAFCALFIPGPIVMCMLYVTPQVAVIERLGVVGALHRSNLLTRGHKLAIFVLLIILGGLGWASGRLVVAVTLPHLNDSAYLGETVARVPLYMYVNLARLLLFGSLCSVMASVSYFLLRAEKEGTSAAELAAVFD